MAVGTSPRQSAKRAASHSTDVHFIADLITPVSCLLVLWGVLAAVLLSGAPDRLHWLGSAMRGHRALVGSTVLAGTGLIVVLVAALLMNRFARRVERAAEGRVAAAQRGAYEQAAAAEAAEAALRNGFRQILASLGRRNQSLLHRQLRIIDTLEQQASSPAALAELFTLDHLTTRMRRHAESLTVLSGAAPGRSWSGPVPIIDVMRAAAAEVEDYTRVTVISDAEEAVAAVAVTDMIHLLAELIENATLFSPSSTRVEIRAERVANGFAVEVTDRGLGIPADQLRELNAQLAEPLDVGLADADRLGLFVAGRLAARHGVHVALGPSPYLGTKAVVVLPDAIVVSDPADPGRLRRTPAGRLHPAQPARTAGALADRSGPAGTGRGRRRRPGRGAGGQAGPGRPARPAAAGAARQPAGRRRRPGGDAGRRASPGTSRSRPPPRTTRAAWRPRCRAAGTGAGIRSRPPPADRPGPPDRRRPDRRRRTDAGLTTPALTTPASTTLPITRRHDGWDGRWERARARPRLAARRSGRPGTGFPPGRDSFPRRPAHRQLERSDPRRRGSSVGGRGGRAEPRGGHRRPLRGRARTADDHRARARDPVRHRGGRGQLPGGALPGRRRRRRRRLRDGHAGKTGPAASSGVAEIPGHASSRPSDHSARWRQMARAQLRPRGATVRSDRRSNRARGRRGPRPHRRRGRHRAASGHRKPSARHPSTGGFSPCASSRSRWPTSRRTPRCRWAWCAC